jgi:uncharacterized protein YecE (DUF72 family)
LDGIKSYCRFLKTRSIEGCYTKMAASIFIGTSGWKYKHWDGVFYPKDLRKKDQLNYYFQQFDTVELNNSFYRQPSVEQFREWKKAVPENFLFAVKANRFFTHLKKLNVQAVDVDDFLSKCNGLEKKLGPILFQLPPSWKVNTQRLEHFLALLPKSYRFTFEFRNDTWYSPEVYQLLEKHNASFCIYELDGHQSPLTVTADFIYIRLHGPGAKYQGSYTDKNLQEWVNFIQDKVKEGKDVYIYFDNDQEGYAAFNAQRLRELLTENSQ